MPPRAKNIRRIPYSPAPPVITFIDACVHNGVPDIVVRSDLPLRNKSMKSHLFTALVWLNLIDFAGNPSGDLFKLVEARKAGGGVWNTALQTVLKDAYAEVLGDLQFETATVDDLQECFRKHFPDYSEITIYKSAGFLSSLRTRTGIRVAGSRSPAGMRVPMSDKVPTNPVKTRKPKKKKMAKKLTSDAKTTLQIKMKGEVIGELSVSEKLTQDEFDDIVRSFDGIKAYLSTFITGS